MFDQMEVSTPSQLKILHSACTMLLYVWQGILSNNEMLVKRNHHYHFFIPLTDTDAMISADPNTFTPWHEYRPSSDLEALRIRRLPCGSIVTLKRINT